MKSPLGEPHYVGKCTRVGSIGAGIALRVDKASEPALILDLFADLDGTQRLHQVPYVLSPYLAGKIAASLALRCNRLGQEAMAEFSQAMADATATYHAKHGCEGCGLGEEGP